jgi:hypothetical protein
LHQFLVCFQLKFCAPFIIIIIIIVVVVVDKNLIEIIIKKNLIELNYSKTHETMMDWTGSLVGEDKKCIAGRLVAKPRRRWGESWVARIRSGWNWLSIMFICNFLELAQHHVHL